MDPLAPIQLAHAGHPAYDHPAMAAIAIAAIVIPFGVLFVVGRTFWRSSKQAERERGEDPGAS